MHVNHNARKSQQHRVHKQASNSDAYAFFNLLTGEQLLGKVESLLPDHRERLYPPDGDPVDVHGAGAEC
jgi:hypothetical protein